MTNIISLEFLCFKVIMPFHFPQIIASLLVLLLLPISNGSCRTTDDCNFRNCAVAICDFRVNMTCNGILVEFSNNMTFFDFAQCPAGNDSEINPKKLTGNCTKGRFPRCIPDRCRQSNLCIFIAGVIAGILLVFIVSAAFCYIRKRKRSETLKSTLSERHLLYEAAVNSNVPFYSFREMERATNGFAENLKLGTGAYGTVYVGKLQNNEVVAIKRIKHHSMEQVRNEIELVSSVSHPNLVRLLGCSIQRGEQMLVYEYMPNGTLSQHLQRTKGFVLPWTIRLNIAVETAHAIAHLHSEVTPPIYHRDVKSNNILLDYNFNSKVADFGLSRFGMTDDDSHVSTAPQGTPGYVDPQYHQNFHLSDKSDVYSFGVVLVEIVTAMKAIDFSRPHTEVNLAALAIDRIRKGRLREIIDPFLEANRDIWTLSSVHKVAELAFRCLAFHKEMRPTMVEVAQELEQIRQSGWAPLEENNSGQLRASADTDSSHVSGSSEKREQSNRQRAFIISSDS